MNENIFKKIFFKKIGFKKPISKQKIAIGIKRVINYFLKCFTNRKEDQMRYLYRVIKNKVMKKIALGINFTFSFLRLFSNFFLRNYLKKCLKKCLKRCLKGWFSKEEVTSTIKASGILVMTSMILFLPELALAADHANAFGDASKAISDMLKGTLGKTIALSSLTLGVVSSAIRFNAPVLLGSAGVAAAVGLGPGIIDKLL